MYRSKMRIIFRVLHKNYILKVKRGHALVQLVEALRYNPEGRGLDNRWGSLEFFMDVILGAAL